MAPYSTAPLLLLLLIPFFIFPISTATVYQVGSPESKWEAGVDWAEWATHLALEAGDVLEFVFDLFDDASAQGGHVVVNAASLNGYQTCDETDIFGKYDSGDISLVLPEAGTYYFFCTPHCNDDKPMKFFVNVG